LYSIGKNFIKKTRATFWSSDHKYRLACTISKRYPNQGIIKYWYAHHPAWEAFLNEGEIAYLILGCTDLDFAFAIPNNIINDHLAYFNKTTKSDGSYYWHLKIIEKEDKKYFLYLPQTEPLSIDNFIFPVYQRSIS